MSILEALWIVYENLVIALDCLRGPGLASSNICVTTMWQLARRRGVHLRLAASEVESNGRKVVCCKVAARGMRHLAGRDRWSAPWASMVGYAMTGLQPAYDILEAPRPLL